MVGSAETFLQYNEDNVMKQLLAIEAHLRNLSPSYESEHASCVIKHILQLDEQCDEGISHASELGYKEKVEIFRKVKAGIPRFRKKLYGNRTKNMLILETRIHPSEAIKEVRKLRRIAENLNPNYNLEKCETCGPIEGVLKQLGIPSTNLQEIEQETAQNILSHLAYKYKVPKPKLVISDECANPAFGVYEARSKPEKSVIRVCRGGVNVHVLAHEFKHYLDHLAGKPLWRKSLEPEAEKFAIIETQGKDKVLYKNSIKHNYTRGGNSLETKGLLGIYGPDWIAKGLERGFKQIDIVTGRAALPAHLRPSFWLNLAGMSGGILGGLKLREPWDLVAAVMGAHMSTTMMDYAEEYVAPALRVIFAPPEVQGTVKYVVKKPTVIVPATKVKTLPTVTGRYAITA